MTLLAVVDYTPSDVFFLDAAAYAGAGATLGTIGGFIAARVPTDDLDGRLATRVRVRDDRPQLGAR